MKNTYLPFFQLCLAAAVFLAGGCGKERSTSGSNTKAAEPTTAEASDKPEKQDDTQPATSNPADESQSADTDSHGPGRGMGRGHGARGGFRADMTTIHAMFAARDKIRRSIKNLANGAETLTESDDEEIAGLIQEHVPAMEGRVNDDDPLPPMTFQPLFIELIKDADKVDISYEGTELGIKVTYTSDDPHMVRVIQEHAKLVSRFIKNGMSEVHKPYTLPKEKTSDSPEP